MRVRVIGRVEVNALDLVFEAVILPQGDRKHRAQRNALRAEQREALLDALDDALKPIGPRLARPVAVKVGAREAVLPPHKAQDGRRVGYAVNLDQLVKL